MLEFPSSRCQDPVKQFKMYCHIAFAIPSAHPPLTMVKLHGFVMNPFLDLSCFIQPLHNLWLHEQSTPFRESRMALAVATHFLIWSFLLMRGLARSMQCNALSSYSHSNHLSHGLSRLHIQCDQLGVLWRQICLASCRLHAIGCEGFALVAVVQQPLSLLSRMPK